MCGDIGFGRLLMVGCLLAKFRSSCIVARLAQRDALLPQAVLSGVGQLYLTLTSSDMTIMSVQGRAECCAWH